MSGHSHAKTIRHQKNITDQKRGKMFSKMARVILVAVKSGGSNPETNSKLRLAIETAKKVNMPKENVERAIKKASGAGGAENLEEISFEAFGPGGIAIIVEVITDNKNRTLGEVKQILNQHNGKLANEGSVKWLFDKKGVILINTKDNDANLKKEDVELKAIESGADDVYWHDDILDVYTKPEDLEKVKKSLEDKGIKIDSASWDSIAKEEVALDEETKIACEKLFETLDENDSVQEVYSNLKSKPMIILGIDPGTASTGYGVIKKIQKGFKCLAYGVIKTKPGVPAGERLEKIHNELTDLIKEHSPEVLIMESLFFFRNFKTVIPVSQAGGVILFTAAKNKLPVHQFTPLQVKLAVAGSGRAEKEMVQKKIKLLLKLKEIPKPDDVADALAVAATFYLYKKKVN